MFQEQPAWAFERSVDCKVAPELAWAFWTNIDNLTLDSDVQSVEMDGPFVAGIRADFGILKWPTSAV
jgi:hypothetical protein